MPFNVKNFQENINNWTKGKTRLELMRECKKYVTLTTQQQKAHCIKEMMVVLDQNTNAKTSRMIMEACGRRCISASTLQKARRIKQKAQNLDEMLNMLNEAHIGGGHLKREGGRILGIYDRCYCGSVSKTKELFSNTYCQCTCGWYRQLFEMLLEKTVEVELLSSIIQGNDRCRIAIHI